jgi:Holliday junction resolvase RusA-like endonuclease
VETPIFKARVFGRVGIKKNGKRLFVSKYGKPGLATSENYQTWHRSATLQLLQAKALSQFTMPITQAVNLKCVFHFPDHRGEPDLSNCFQGLEDILQEIGIIENDRQVYGFDGSTKIFGSEDYYIDLEVTPYEISLVKLTEA